ncbi:MAG: hypothetical protein ABJH63_14055 [Rhizobiaceae bacterium]
MVGNFRGDDAGATANRILSGKHLILLALCGSLVTGCTGQKLANPLAKLNLGAEKRDATHTATHGHEHGSQHDHMTTASVKAAEPKSDMDGFIADSEALAAQVQAETHDHPELPWTDDITTGSVEPKVSAQGRGGNKVERISTTVSAACRRILAEAGIETTMLRSPTLNGSVNSDEDISVGASYDLLDLRRASLKDELAVVRCSRDDVAAKLAQLLVTSNHSHSQAGYRAKAEHLNGKRSEITSIKGAIEKGLQQGDLTVFRATALRQELRQLEGEAARAEGEANKRHIVRHIQGQSFRDLDTRLVKAEQRMQDLERQIRNADALTVKTSVNYAKRGDGSDDVTISDDGEVTAKISFSVRLGGYSPQRFELEDVAREARTASLHEVNRGILWRSNEAARVNRTVVGSLQQQRAKLVTALSAARANARTSAGGDQSELLDATLKGRIQVVRLSAELAAMNATFADSGYLDKKLTFRR